MSAALLLGIQAVPAAASANGQRSSVYDLQAGLVEVGGATATLTRSSQGLGFSLNTSGLNGGDAYTVWWIVFNQPQYCTHPMLTGLACGVEDLYAPDFGLFGDPRVDGRPRRGNNGKAGFGGYLSAGSDADAVVGSGLSDPAGAEVMLDVLDHGTKDPGTCRIRSTSS